MTENEIGDIIITSAIKIHRELGPGLLESVYEVILAKVLAKERLLVQRQVSIPIEYEGECFEESFRADLVVEGKVMIELKSVEALHPSHKKQLLTYIKLAKMKLGYILNFGESLMKNGIVRIINGEL
jgi:GxxExxY protein